MDLIPKQYKSDNPMEMEGGLKSRGISISGKQSPLFFFLNKWVIISLAGLLIALAVFGAIKIYIFYTQKNIAKLEQEIENYQIEQDEETVKKITEIDKSINTVTNLLKNHIRSSLFFVNLERLTIPQVQWAGVNLNTLQGTTILNGKAVDYSFLAKQIISFEEGGFQVSVSGINFNKDFVGFSAKIQFDPKILVK